MEHSEPMCEDMSPSNEFFFEMNTNLTVKPPTKYKDEDETLTEKFLIESKSGGFIPDLIVPEIIDKIKDEEKLNDKEDL